MLNIVLCISLVGHLGAANRITTDSNHEVENILIESSRTRSPGVIVGWTDYDWQPYGSKGRRFMISQCGGFHFLWGHEFGPYYYNYYYPPSYWLGPTLIIPDSAERVCSMNQMTDGRALFATLVTITGGYVVRIYLDAGEGYGTFTVLDLPNTGMPSDPIWLNTCVDYADYIYFSMPCSTGLYMIHSTDEGVTWSDWILVDSTGGHESWAAFTGKTAVVYHAGTDYENVCYWETTDQGVTWTTDTIFIPSPEDSVVGYIWNSAVYDNNEYLHVVFACIDTSQAGQGGLNCSGWRSQIRHWNQTTGQISLVASGWWTLDPGPGTIHPTVSECQLAIDRATGTLYCTWCQADSGDVAANGYTNLEIYGTYSNDNGTTWSVPVNITNSQSPGASAGACEHDWWQTTAEITHGDTIYIFYMNDKDAGSSVQGEGISTDNPMLFYAYYFPVGIEEHNTKEPLKLTLHVAPNPVSHRLTISYALPQSGNVSLELYSVDGRLVKTIYEGHKKSGVHKDNLDFTAIANGIYFIILETATAKESYSVVVIH